MKKTLYLIRHGTAQHNVLFQNLGKRVFYDTRYIDTKLTQQGIEEAQKLRDAGIKAHEDGNHSESEKLLNQALQLFKS